MTRQLLVLLMLLSPLSWAEAMQNLESLSDLKWKNRLILIEADQPIQHYQDELDRLDADIVDRDIVWFIVNDKDVINNFNGKLSDSAADEIRQTLQSHSSAVLLIGKDGGIKATETQLILDELFGEIDRMPMRQQELQSR
ncbi:MULTISPECIES: DUF4174 domain-containing protein [unclassified Methylophaga]|jgi:hypothetical protein|uniref:DUF4174 domain-containing protein n=1 Tax=unclassified Methylophaga TaxID=2629249 RepID=UPI00259C8D7B|nr:MULTISPECIES: DUF4174 domain-containing protein [unclassified Methylophaga]|tara:strand:+ start:12661 stop:13080 length:420 start_codon:yes stop_codon:yes gene_type:complete